MTLHLCIELCKSLPVSLKTQGKGLPVSLATQGKGLPVSLETEGKALFGAGRAVCWMKRPTAVTAAEHDLASVHCTTQRHTFQP